MPPARAPPDRFRRSNTRAHCYPPLFLSSSHFLLSPCFSSSPLLRPALVCPFFQVRQLRCFLLRAQVRCTGDCLISTGDNLLTLQLACSGLTLHNTLCIFSFPIFLLLSPSLASSIAPQCSKQNRRKMKFALALAVLGASLVSGGVIVTPILPDQRVVNHVGGDCFFGVITPDGCG